MSQEMRLKIAIAIDEFEEAVRAHERAKNPSPREAGYAEPLQSRETVRQTKLRKLTDLLQQATGSAVPAFEDRDESPVYREDCPVCGEPQALEI